MKIPGSNARFISPGLASILAAIMLATGSALAAEQQAPPQVTPEGLNLVASTETRLVYAADDADLAQYSKVMIVECAVAFEKNWQRDYNRSFADAGIRVRDEDVARMKKRLATEFKKVFTETMVAHGFDVVTAAASDVLILRPALINVVANAPDVMSSSKSRTYVTSAGHMTLYLELYDSVSSSLLAKVYDVAQDDRATLSIAGTNKAMNLAAVDRILASWAGELAAHFAEVAGPAPEKP